MNSKILFLINTNTFWNKMNFLLRTITTVYLIFMFSIRVHARISSFRDVLSKNVLASGRLYLPARKEKKKKKEKTVGRENIAQIFDAAIHGMWYQIFFEAIIKFGQQILKYIN